MFQSFHGIQCKNTIYQTPTICQALEIQWGVRESSGTQANHRSTKKPMIIFRSPVHLTFYCFLRKILNEWVVWACCLYLLISVFPHRLCVFFSTTPVKWFFHRSTKAWTLSNLAITSLAPFTWHSSIWTENNSFLWQQFSWLLQQHTLEVFLLSFLLFFSCLFAALSVPSWIVPQPLNGDI